MKKHKKLIIIIVIIAIVVGLGIWVASCAKKTTSLLANMSNSAKTAQVVERDIVNTVSATGTITSLSTTSLTTTLSGIKVEQVNVSLGDKVSKDDIICLLDDSDLEEKLEDAQYSKDKTNKLLSIEQGSASRGLNDALESQAIDSKRAQEKVDKAQDTLKKYEDKADAAYQKYADAHNESAKTFNEIQDLQKKNEDIKAEISELKTQMAELKTSFSEKRAALVDYLTELASKNVEVNISVVSSLKFGEAANLPTKSIYSGDDSAILANIKEYIHALRDFETPYKEKESKVTELKAAYSNNNASLEKLNAQYEANLKTESTLKEAYELQAESVSTYEDSLKQTIQAKEDTERADSQAVQSRKDSLNTTAINSESSKRSADSSVESVEEQITDCTVKSPVDGIITAINVAEGDTYNGGVLVTIEDTSSYEVSVNIDEYDISKVKPGQKVIIKTNGTGDTELEGIVKTVSPRAEKASTSVEYKVIVSVLTTCDDLRLDMTAKIEIILEEKENVLAVPRDAIQVDEKGNFFVEVLDSGSPVDYSALINASNMTGEEMKKYQNADSSYESHRVYITKGLESDYYVEVISDELSDGMTLVIPQNDLFSDIGSYMDETGATGGM